MSQGERVNNPKEKKKVQGRSIEEMKERRNIAVEEDTEEMKKMEKSESRRVRKKTRGITLESGEKIAGREFSLCLKNTICSVRKIKQEELTEEEGIDSS